MNFQVQLNAVYAAATLEQCSVLIATLISEEFLHKHTLPQYAVMTKLLLCSNLLNYLLQLVCTNTSLMIVGLIHRRRSRGGPGVRTPTKIWLWGSSMARTPTKNSAN
jgi:hypothetical protein